MAMKRKSSAYYLFACLVVMSIVLAACGQQGSGGPTPTPLPAVVKYEKAIFTVERGPIVAEQEMLGEIVPAKQDELFFRASGFVTRVAVKAGDMVKAGDILAEQQIDDLLNQLQQAEIDLQVAQAELNKYNAERDFNIEKAKADVVIWEKRVALSMIAVDETYGEHKVKAQLNLEIDEQNLIMAEQALKMVSEENNPYHEQSVKRAELSVERLKGLLAERQIVAPYDAIILRDRIRPGQSIEAYNLAFVVGDPAGLVIRATQDTDLSDDLNKDTEVRVYLKKEDEQSYPSAFLPNFLPVSASDEQAVKAFDSSGNNYFYFQIPEGISRDQLEVGQSIDLVVVLGRKEDVLLLPPAAIREYRGLNFVIVQEGDRRRRVEINEIGLRASDKWEVVADLREGDQVLGP